MCKPWEDLNADFQLRASATASPQHRKALTPLSSMPLLEDVAGEKVPAATCLAEQPLVLDALEHIHYCRTLLSSHRPRPRGLTPGKPRGSLSITIWPAEEP